MGVGAHRYVQMMRDSNHRLLLPAACCLWLAINDYGQHGAWSFDHAVRRVIGPRLWPFGHSTFRDKLRGGTSSAEATLPKPIAVSRRLCLVTAVCVFFSAGFSKMTQGHESWSLAWASGETLGLKMRAGPAGDGESNTLPKLLTPLLRENGLIPALAASSLAVEVLAPLALGPWVWPRRVLSMAWAAFHVGVLLTMYVCVWLQCRRRFASQPCDACGDCHRKFFCSTYIATELPWRRNHMYIFPV